MATNIELVTYAGKTVTPLDDALIYENAVTNGIIDGCECTLSGGNTIHMEGGHGIICGRKFTVYESDTNIPLSSGGTLNGRMKVHLDLSDTGEPIQFIVESASSLPALVQQDDVNVNNGIYEFVMCTFSVSETAVTNFTQVFPTAYPESREIATYGATTAQLASTDKILVQKANGDTYSMSYSALINSLAATLITRSGTVTDSKHALSAVENNPNVSDTLAAKISALNSSLNNSIGNGIVTGLNAPVTALSITASTHAQTEFAEAIYAAAKLKGNYQSIFRVSRSGSGYLAIVQYVTDNYGAILLLQYGNIYVWALVGGTWTFKTVSTT